MKTLLLMRHAKSSHDDAGLSDHARPLNARGRGDAPLMAARLAEEGLLPDHLLSSTARRAKETAELFLTAAESGLQAVLADRLYLAPPDEILAVIAESAGDSDRLLVVGHTPGMEELVTRLIGVETTMPTAAVARIDLPIASWRDATRPTNGSLAGFWKPKDAAG